MVDALEGTAASVRALLDFEGKVGDAVRDAVGTVAHLVERGAKQRAPVRTGTLRRSVTVFGPTSLGAGHWEAYIGPTAVYGRRVELGFHGADRLGRVFDQAGQPYLEPAFNAAMAEASTIFARSIAGVS